MRQAFHAGHHYKELDSLRGLAAITVLIGHYLHVFRVQSGPYADVGHKIEMARKTPLFALFAGHESVMLFFVLSGFVLSLQFLKGKPVDYSSYAVKRVFRIYVPYLAALSLALLCCRFLYSGHIADLSTWFNTPWSGGITLSALADHAVFLGSFKSDVFDPVLWSLVHELRISFLFPFLTLFLVLGSWRSNVTIALLLSLFGMTATLALNKLKIDLDYFLTLHYAAMFIFGFLLAQNINAIFAWLRQRSTAERVAVAAAGFCLYTFSHLLPGRLGYYEDLPIAAGAALLVITAVCSARTSAFLQRPVVKFFGDISYSLYLYHAIMLLAFTHVLYGKLPIAAILSLAAGASVLASWISYRFVELPAIRMGKKIVDRMGAAAADLAPASTARPR